jgi:hypothetical protein
VGPFPLTGHVGPPLLAPVEVELEVVELEVVELVLLVVELALLVAREVVPPLLPV